MQKFRKKPVIIEAEQIVAGGNFSPELRKIVHDDGVSLRVNTPNGPLAVEVGDWVVKGTTPGDYYPVKRDIFPTLFDVLEYAENTTPVNGE